MQKKDFALPLETLIEDRYKANDYDILYSGASGVLMKASHRWMERGIKSEQNARVLEVGGGGMPHYYWMNSARTETYTVSDKIALHLTKMELFRKEIPSRIHFLLHDFDRDPSLETVEGNYTRVIASHVLEHIPDPERAILKWASLLATDGVLSIAIPCDPGWLWRLGQIFAFRGYQMQVTFQEYDLVMSREHINSVQRILKIIRYYFRAPKVNWFPLMVPIVDVNFVCIINVKASDFRQA